MLDILKEYDVKATFCNWKNRCLFKSIYKRIVDGSFNRFAFI